jgi:hypothetical protein
VFTAQKPILLGFSSREVNKLLSLGERDFAENPGFLAIWPKKWACASCF